MREKISFELNIGTLIYIATAILAVLVIYNQLTLNELSGVVKTLSTAGVVVGSSSISSASTSSSTSSTSTVSSFDVIPKGVPPIYGNELGVSFDDVSVSNAQKADATIRKLATLDNQISLSGADLQRYIKIASQISCEYCCGAQSIITSSGNPACGCAHSYAMRGLAKYLIKNHPNEYTDDQILEELGKWKTLFFPSQITQKAAILQSKGIELNYINLASNKYRGIESGSSGGGMVGGC